MGDASGDSSSRPTKATTIGGEEYRAEPREPRSESANRDERRGERRPTWFEIKRLRRCKLHSEAGSTFALSSHGPTEMAAVLLRLTSACRSCVL